MDLTLLYNGIIIEIIIFPIKSNCNYQNLFKTDNFKSLNALFFCISVLEYIYNIHNKKETYT